MKQMIEYFKGFNEGDNITITCDFIMNIEELIEENQSLKEQLEELDKKLFFTKNELEMRQKSIDNKLNQQKEFIEWLEDKLCIANKILDEPEEDEEVRGYVLARKFMLEEILSKYKAIKCLYFSKYI